MKWRELAAVAAAAAVGGAAATVATHLLLSHSSASAPVSPSPSRPDTSAVTLHTQPLPGSAPAPVQEGAQAALAPSSFLRGKVIVVTGASSGIGREIALMCAEYGARVIGLDVTEKPLEGGRPTVEEFAHRHSPTETTCGTMDKDVVAGYSSGTCGEVVFVCGDTTRAEDCAAAVAMAVEKWGRLDVWVNNAAIGSTVSGRLTELSEDEWRRVLEVDVTGYMLGTRAAVRQFLCQEVVTSTMARGDDASGDGPRVGLRGRVINIGSQHGMVACPGDLAYGVGKAAAVYMARQVAVDYATEGIACNAISPGKVLTGHDTDHRPYSLARTPCTRLGVPRDIAAAVLFLCSPLASEYLTGSNLVVDGGWMAY